jgi:predicted alpha/beta hydrolase family esterase
MTHQPTLIVPGLHGSGPGHWQDWWRHDHPNAHVVAQDDWSNPDESRWLERLERAIVARPGSRLVAHSLGAILVAKLARSRVASLVSSALLVAPADINRTSSVHQRSYEFGTMPHDGLPFPAVVVASRDDPYMPYDKARSLAVDWGAGLHDLGHAGHVNIASGFGRWVAGYGLADRLVAQRQAS